MIGSIAYAFARSVWGRYLMIGLAVLAGVRVWGAVKFREGRRDEQMRRSVEEIKSMRRMQDAAASVATDRNSIVERLRGAGF